MRGEEGCTLRDISFSYPGATRNALEGLSLVIPSGSWVAIVGSNGSGKSTLARILNALLVPTQGSSFIYGMDTSDPRTHSAVRRNVAMVFQNPENQIVAATVEEDTAFGPENLGLPPLEIRRRVDEALLVAGLSALRRHPVYALSGGQKQRLAVAGALALQPRCLVLDEATAMLDPQGRADLSRVLRQLNRQGMTLVSITHRLEEIICCNIVHVLSEGRLVWSGTPLAFFEKPRPEWGMEDVPLFALWRRLRLDGVLAPDVLPGAREVAEALCPST